MCDLAQVNCKSKFTFNTSLNVSCIQSQNWIVNTLKIQDAQTCTHHAYLHPIKCMIENKITNDEVP